LGAEAVARVRRNLAADYVVAGAYTALGAAAGGKVRVELRVVDTKTGDTVASVPVSGTEAELFDLVARSGAALRQRLGVERAAGGGRPSFPAAAAAGRAYFEGIEALRRFEPLAAKERLEASVAAD